MSEISKFGRRHDRVGDRYREYSPFHNISADSPQALLFYGTSDGLTPLKTIADFKAGMQKAGVRCDLVLHERQGHGCFSKEPCRPRLVIQLDKSLAAMD